MSSEIEKFQKLYPNIKYPVWKVGARFFLNSKRTLAEAYAASTKETFEVVEKLAPAKQKGKSGGEKIEDNGAE